MPGVPDNLVGMLKEIHSVVTSCLRNEVDFRWQFAFRKAKVNIDFYTSDTSDYYDIDISSEDFYDLFNDELIYWSTGLSEVEPGVFTGTYPLDWEDFSSEASPVCVVWRLVREAPIPDKEKRKASILYWVGGEPVSDLGAAGSAIVRAPSSISVIAGQPSAAIPVVCVGCSGYPIPLETLLLLTASQVGIVISEPNGDDFVEVPFSEVHSLEFEGGAYQKGGGFSGGGFGIGGFIVGAASAMALNKLTTKTEIHSQIHVLSSQGEIVLYTNVGTPQDLEVALADARTRIRNVQRSQLSQNVNTPTGGLADELSKLTALHQNGALSDEEFQAAKRRLLS